MSNDLAIKVYDVDYSFIMKNYLDKELWNKTWTVFQWRNVIANISLWRIDVYDESVFMNVKVTDSDTGKSSSMLVYYFVDKCDIKFLKRKINSAIMDCIISIERQIIQDTGEYKNIRNMEYKEDKIISKIVEKYFNSKNIKSEVVIESTVEKCKENITRSGKFSDDYLDSMKYRVLEDLFLEFSRISDKEIDKSNLSTIDVVNNSQRYSDYIETEDFEKYVINYVENDEYEDSEELPF